MPAGGDWPSPERDHRATEVGLWTRQFGSTARDGVAGVTVERAGNVHMVGDTGGTLPGETSAGGSDAFVIKVVQ